MGTLGQATRVTAGDGALPPLIRALLQPRAWPHPVGELQLVETHISWVILTCEFAYKLKKPVDLGFLNFSTLEKRCRACGEEIRLNGRIAPELYLGRVPITGSEDEPVVGQVGDSRNGQIECAVKMRQFPQEAQLDHQLAAGLLGEADADALATRIARMHATAGTPSKDMPYGWPRQVHAPMWQTLEVLIKDARGRMLRDLQALQHWSNERATALAALMAARRLEGFVRELHGDLHLANIVRLGDAMVPFDCIEFSEELRWIDTFSDLAFLLMDLRLHGRSDLATRTLNRYLEITGDYAGMPLLRYYEVYRALVRAKIALIRRREASCEERRVQGANLREHIALARQIITAERAGLILMHGLSGSGKTWLSSALLAPLRAVRVRSDIERKRLHGLSERQGSGSAVGKDLYAPESSARTYARLAECAEAILEGGRVAIVDAAFLRRADRERLRALALRRNLPFAIVFCTAPEQTLKARVQARKAAGSDASEADAHVVDYQAASVETLDAEERQSLVMVDAGREVDTAALAAELRRRTKLD